MEQMGRAEKGSIVVLTQTPLRLPHHVIQREDQTLLFLRVCVCVFCATVEH